MKKRSEDGYLSVIFAGFLIFYFIPVCGTCQQADTSATVLDNSRINHQRHGAGGIEAGYGSRSDGFHGIFFRAFYEAQIDRTFLNAGAFSYNKINDGFGFDFRLRIPALFYPSGSHTNFSPLAGMSFNVWPVDKPTVSIGFPVGLEYEFLIDNFPNISLSANAAPLVSLSSTVKNTVLFDLRFGIRFD